MRTLLTNVAVLLTTPPFVVSTSFNVQSGRKFTPIMAIVWALPEPVTGSGLVLEMIGAGEALAATANWFDPCPPGFLTCIVQFANEVPTFIQASISLALTTVVESIGTVKL